MVQVKRTLLILYISLTCHLRQLGDSSYGVEAGGTIMAPQLVKMGRGVWTRPFPLHPENFVSSCCPRKPTFPHWGGGVGAAAEKGTGWIRLTEFYTGHIRQLEKFT